MNSKTNTLQELKHWQKEHYIAYLYLAVADSDSNISSNELLSVLRKLNYNFSHDLPQSELDYSEVVNEVLSIMSNQTLETRHDTIDALSKKFELSENLSDYIVSDLSDVMMEDDQILPSEHSMISFIRKALLPA